MPTPTTPTDLTRRAFLAASAGAAVSAAAGARPASAPAIGRKRADTVRVGLVGCGGRGTGAALQALRADPGAELHAIADAFPPAIEPCLANIRQGLAENAGAGAPADSEHRSSPDRANWYTGFDAYQQLIDSGCDVVLLCTPPGFRPQHLAACVDAGKHVFCEKPVAVDGPGVRSVLESARKSKEKGLALMSGFCWRHQNQVRACFDKVLSGGIGDVHTVQCTYNTTGWVTPKPRKPEWSDTEWQLRNWQYFVPLSGDHIVEQAVHAIDWIAWAFGDDTPTKCTAVGGRQTRPNVPETGNVYDHFSVTYEYEGGRRGYHMCRHWPNTASDNSAYMTGSEGNCIMSPWAGTHVIRGKNNWRGTTPGNDMYQAEHDELFKSIREGAPFNDGVRMAHTTLLAIMGRMAAYTGAEVTWDQALNSQEKLGPAKWDWGPLPMPALAIPGRTPLV